MYWRKLNAVGAAGLAFSAGLLAVPQDQKKKPVRRRSTAKQAPARPVAPKWRPGQSVPTPDRYKEIQEALAKKGYLRSEPSGVWDQNSTDALRRFQQDQSLQASGKLDSLSIIALGLGPKH